MPLHTPWPNEPKRPADVHTPFPKRGIYPYKVGWKPGHALPPLEFGCGGFPSQKLRFDTLTYLRLHDSFPSLPIFNLLKNMLFNQISLFLSGPKRMIFLDNMLIFPWFGFNGNRSEHITRLQEMEGSVMEGFGAGVVSSPQKKHGRIGFLAPPPKKKTGRILWVGRF